MVHLFLEQCLHKEAVIVRKEEDRATLARAAQHRQMKLCLTIHRWALGRHLPVDSVSCCIYVHGQLPLHNTKKSQAQRSIA